MKNTKFRFDRTVRTIGLLLIYVVGLLSIVASGGGSGGGGDDEPDPAEGPGAVASVEITAPNPIEIDIEETIEITVVAKDASGRVVPNVEPDFALSDKVLADIESNSITGIAASEGSLIATVDKVDSASVVVTVNATPTPVIEVPLLWPVDQVRADNDRELLSQGFNEYSDGSANRFHSGWDVRGFEDVATVRAVADGWLHFIQEETTEFNCDGRRCDHFEGNVVILGHRRSDGSTIYSQYAHLSNKNGDFVEKQLSIATKDGALCDEYDAVRKRRSCERYAIWVKQGEALGKVGTSGGWDQHLHFEIKENGFLGSSLSTHDPKEGENGYRQYGYSSVSLLFSSNVGTGFIDPLPYFNDTVDYRTAPEFEEHYVTEEGSGEPILMGPGGHIAISMAGGFGAEDVNGPFTKISSLTSGQRYLVAGTSEAVPGVITGVEQNNQGETIGTRQECDSGWLLIRQVDGERIKDTSPKFAPGEWDFAWTCKGHDDLEYLSVTPDLPSNLRFTGATEDSLSLAWDPVTNTDVGYALYRDGVQLPASIGFAMYTDAGLESGAQYCYRVTAIDGNGYETEPSEEVCSLTAGFCSAGTPFSGEGLAFALESQKVSTCPTTPVDVVANATSETSIWVTWSSSAGATGYRIFRDQEQYDVSTPEFEETGLASGAEYCYTVSAISSAGEVSVPSDSACATTPISGDSEPPTAPTGVTLQVDSQESITVSWVDATDNVGVAEYRLFRDSAEIGSTTELQYQDTQLTPGTNYCYFVVAADAAGNASPPSAEECADTQSANAELLLEVVSSVDPVDDGTDLTITMTISNPGSVTRNNVLLEAVMPDYMSPAETATSPIGDCIGYNGSCPSGETMQWALGNLAAGEQFVVSYTDTVSTLAVDGALLTAIASVTADGIASIQDSHTVVVSEAPPPYQVGVNADENPAGPGEEFRYRIRYSNRSAASADTLSLTLSDSVTFVSGTGGASPTGQIVTWPALSVAAGDNGLEEVTVMVNAGEPAGHLLRTEAAFGTTNSQATGANVVAVNAAPPLELAIVSSVDPVDDGTDLTITMTISNPGSVTRNNVLLEAVMPDYMSPAETATSPIGDCIGYNGSCPSGETMQWALGNLAAGEQFVVSYTDRVSTAAADGALLTAIASVTADGIASIQDSHTVVVSEAPPPYQVGVNTDENPAGPGEEFRYRIRYSNRSAASADTLSLTLSDSVTFVSGTGGASPTGQIVTWPALSVAAGDNGLEEVTVMVNAGEPAGHLLRTEAAFGTTNSQATGANVVAVNAAPPLELAIVSSVDPVDDGTDLTITMTISNPGSVTRNNVLLEAVMPDYMSPAETATSPIGDCIGYNGSCPSGETMQWALGNLAAGEQFVVSYTDTVSTLAVDGALLTAIASVTADGIASIQDSHTVVVSEAPPPYQVGVNTDENPAGPGEEFRYRIRYSNRSAASADTLSLTLSDSVTFVSGTGGASPTGQIVTWPALSVAAGDNGLEEVTVMVNAGEPAGHLLRTEAAFGITNSQATGANVVAVNAAPPLELAIVSSVDPVDDGTDLTITMTISNPGSVTRNNVLLEAVMPDYMSPAETATSPIGDCVGYNGSCPSGETMQWALGNLAAGEQFVVSYTDRVSTAAADGALLTAIASVTADGIASIQDSHTVVVSDAAPPYQVGVNTDENPAGPGEEFRYRIRYSNRSAASADTLSLTLSDSVTFVSGTGGASPIGQIVTWPALSVAAGDNGLEEVTVMVNAGEPAGHLLRTEAAFGITNSQATGANVVAVNAAPPLELAIVSSVDPVDDGTDLTITMTISNPGSVTRNNVLLEAVMPDYMSPAETATSPIGDCIGYNGSCPSGETMQWALGNLAAGEQFVVSYTDTVSTLAVDGALLTAIASVTADGIASIQDSHTVVVSEAPPPYQVGVNADENPAGPGEEFRYRIRYSNRSAASADTLSLTLSDSVTFVSGTGGASPTGQIVTWPALSVAAGDNGLEEVTVMVNAGEPAGHLLRTEAAFGTTNSQATGANVVAVNAAPPLELAIVSSVDPVDDGTDLTITMTISNPGSVTRNNVLLEAVMPDYMSPAETATSPIGDCIGYNGSCPSGETMQWALGNLAAGEQFVVSYTDRVSTAAADGALLTAIASVTADGIASIQDSHTVVVIE